MAFLSAAAIAAIGLGVSAAGLGVQMYGMSQTADANKKLAENQKQSEAVRQQQMTLESMRRKREIIRNAQVASAQATATASAQGGAESSGLMSALSTVSSRAGGATLATNQNEELGNRMFAINSSSADLMGDRASAEATTGFGSGMSSLGGALMKNSTEIHKVGSYLFTPRA